jgi:DNA-binding transcriptional LysR family regulator
MMIRDTFFGDLALLERVVTAGGISAAAAALGTAKSSVSARIGALEAQVGLRLLVRSSRGTRPTPAGERLLEAGRRLHAEVQAALAAARGDEAALAGTLRISCPVGMADSVLVPLLASFLAEHPALRLDIAATDRIVDPRQEGVDVAFRFGWLRGAELGLVARRIGTFEGVLCAAPAYLATVSGTLRNVEDLGRHAWIGYAGFGGERQTLLLTDESGRRHQVALTCRVRTSSAIQVRDWVLAALGVTRLPLMLIEPQLAAGQLVRVLSQCRFDGPSLYAVYSRDRLRPARVQALLGHLQSRRGPRQAEA